MEGIRVLLVDDEVKYVAALVQRLMLRGYDIRGVASGGKALEVLSKMPMDVVVLDVKMPDMDGTEVLRQIKERDLACEVVLCTGYASIEAARRGMELGAFDYVMKPIDIGDLVHKIEDAHAAKALREGQEGPQTD